MSGKFEVKEYNSLVVFRLDLAQLEVAFELTVSVQEARQENAINNDEANILLLEFRPSRSSSYQDLLVEFWVCKVFVQIG